MEKAKNFGVAGLATALAMVVLGATNAVATDLTGQFELDVANIATGSSVVTSYDEVNEINQIDISVRISQVDLDRMLSQKAGVGAYQSAIWFGLLQDDRGSDGAPEWSKNMGWYSGDVMAARTTLLTKMNGDTSLSPFNSTWTTLIEAWYNKDGVWTRMLDPVNGSTSVGEYLTAALGGGKTVGQLVYGEDYVFRMNEKNYALWGFSTARSEAAEDCSASCFTTENTEFVKINLQYDFAIFDGADGDWKTHYFNLEEALAAGAQNIVLKKDVTITGEVTIPVNTIVTVAAGKTITIAKGASLTLEEGVLETEEDGKLVAEPEQIIDLNLVEPEKPEEPPVEEPKQPAILPGESESTADGRDVIIVEGGADDGIIAAIAAENPTFAAFLEDLDDNAIFLDLDDRGGCAVVGCAVDVKLENLQPNTVYYLYHYDDDGKVTYIAAKRTNSLGELTVNLPKFSGNVLTTTPVDLTSIKAPGTGVMTGAVATTTSDQLASDGAEMEIALAGLVATLSATIGAAVIAKKRA